MEGRALRPANTRGDSRVYMDVTGEIVGVARTGDVERDGGDARLAALFDQHHRRLYRLARRLVSTADDARDLVQDTYVRVAQSRVPVPTGASAEEAWLVRVLVNVCRDGWRKRARRAPLDDRHASNAHAHPASDPESVFVARATVWRALETLTPRRRAAVILYELEGAAIPDIARLLGVTAVTVRWHLSRGRRELARVIGRAGTT